MRGQVTNSEQDVLANHPVFIKTNLGILDTVYTDESGAYAFEINDQLAEYAIQTVGYCNEWVLYSDTVRMSADFSNVIDFKICHLETEESCVADIVYNRETDRVIFFDSKRVDFEYVKFYWDFGDGTYSSRAAPRHEYKKEGVYTVRLTIETPLGCVDSAVMEILATSKSFIRGNLRIPGNYLSNAFIWLIGFDSNQNSIIQLVEPDITGKFNFLCAANSGYLVKIVPNFNVQTIPRPLPTYLGGATNWQGAHVLDVGHEILDVNLQAEVSYLYLHGFNRIVGTFEYSVPSNLLPLNVLLLDKALNPIDHALVENGSFSFSDLPRGTYYVLPECPGKVSHSVRIDFMEDFDVAKYCEFRVSSTKIRPVGISDFGAQKEVSVYPMPFNDVLHLEISTSVNLLQIVDMAGIVVMEESLDGETKMSLNTNHLHKGNYILRCFPIGEPPFYQLIVK